MKKLMSLFLAVLILVAGIAGSVAAERDWSQVMPVPSEEQLNQPGELRSPYITFYPDFDECITGLSMNFRIDHDPIGTYICPACWFLDVSEMEKTYHRVRPDYGESVSGYLGFQVLETGEKVLIMSLWNAFCQDEGGNTVREIRPKVISAPEEAEITEHNPLTNGEGSFLQCIIPYEWKTGQDYHFVVEQQTSEQGTEKFILSLAEAQSGVQTELIVFDSGLTDVWIAELAGFVENFVPEAAGQIRSVEFWNVRGRMLSSGAWKTAETAHFNVNNSEGIEDYEGSWNAGSDDRAVWVITSGVPGLCNGPDHLDGYPIPSIENGVTD